MSASPSLASAVLSSDSTAGGEFGFFLLQGEDFFLDAARHHQLVNEYLPGLADAVGAVGGLVFHRGIPPRIVVDDGVGGGEVEADAACLEADQEHRYLAFLETADDALAVSGVGQ
jgi:hypothetical protein